MKTIIRYALLFSLIFCLKGNAQQPGDSKPLSNNTTMKGKRELRREKRVHNAALALAGKNERKARKRNSLGNMTPQHKIPKRKPSKEKNKPEPKNEVVTVEEKTKG